MMKRNFFELALALALMFSLAAGAYACTAQQQLAEKMVRLHVIANSDSAADQALKLKVRDSVLDVAAHCTESATDAQHARRLIEQALPIVEAAAQQTVYNCGFNYPVRARLCNMFFETREYDSFSLPAGYYDAFRIEIGKAQGKNWWCVMFPPLCLSAAEEEFRYAADSAGLSDEEQRLISSGETVYRCKFKLIEWVSEFKKTLQKT